VLRSTGELKHHMGSVSGDVDVECQSFSSLHHESGNLSQLVVRSNRIKYLSSQSCYLPSDRSPP